MTILYLINVFIKWKRLDNYAKNVIIALLAFPVTFDIIILAIIFSNDI